MFIQLIKPMLFLTCIVMFTTGCPPGGGTSSAPTTSTLSISITNYLAGGAGIQCPATLNWRFEPISLSGVQGKSSAFDVTSSYSGTTTQIDTINGFPSYGCIYNDSQIGMAAGTWRIRVTNGLWTTECQKQLVNGNNLAQFVINRPGCI